MDVVGWTSVSSVWIKLRAYISDFFLLKKSQKIEGRSFEGKTVSIVEQFSWPISSPKTPNNSLLDDASSTLVQKRAFKELLLNVT